MVAYVTIAPVATAIVGRLPRRAVLVGADAVRCAAVAALPFIDSAWHVYALVAVMQAASAVFTPTFQAVIPDVLEHEDTYTRALSLSRVAYDLEALLSPVAAGAALAFVAFDSLFVGTAIGFACSALLVVSTTLPAPGAHGVDVAAIRHRIFAGIRRFGQVVELRALLALDLVVASATGFVLVNTAVIVQEQLGRGETDVAIALAAYGAGSMLVALALPRLLDRTGDRPVMLAGAWLVVPVLVATWAVLGPLADSSAAAAWWALLAVWIVAGMATSAILTPTGRLLRRASSQADRPAVFAAQFSLSHLCFLLTYPLAGWVGAAASTELAAVVVAMLALVGTLVASRAWARA